MVNLTYHLEEQSEYPQEGWGDVGEEQIRMNGVSQTTQISVGFQIWNLWS